MAMSGRSTKRILLALILGGTLLIAGISTASAGATTAPVVPSTPSVGWWGGQSTGSCGAYDPLSCPRDTSAYTPAVWSALAAGHGFLNYDLVYHSDFGTAMAGVYQRTGAVDVARTANNAGVRINAWLTVPLSEGTFANENNATEIENAVKDFAAWQAANGIHFGQVILDLELPAGYQAIQQAVVNNDPSGVESLMSANINPTHQCAAAATYRDTIKWAHAHGLVISGSPVLFALDDLENGSVALQDALDMAPVPPSGYGSIYLQAYRAFGVDLGSGLVASYYREMQAYFGAKGQVSLGNTGVPPYNTVTPIVNDIRMLAGLGATQIPIFDFDSTLKNFGVSGVSQILDAANHPMTGSELAAAEVMSPTGTSARALFRTLDDFATASTPVVTAANGHPQVPNAYPGGCTQ